ncbi:lipopolysaccharide heptosyltransferase II [bacterium]|nr:lipopolysaccharide heptosyltransferase II [bacterium]
MFNPKRILIVRFGAIGDLVLTSHFVRVLRKRFPEAQIDFLVKSRFKTLVLYNPNLNQIFSLSETPKWQDFLCMVKTLNAQQYDLVIDLQKNLKSYLISFFLRNANVRRYLKQAIPRFFLVNFKKNFYPQPVQPVPLRYLQAVADLGVKDDGGSVELYVPPISFEKVDRLLATESCSLLIGVAPGGGRWTKCWPAEKFAQLCALLHQRYSARILLFGSSKDKEAVQKIEYQLSSAALNLCGKFSLLETAAAISRCDLIVTNDSGLMHIAAALKRKIVAIFGPTVKELGFFPFRVQAIVVENNTLNCRPCSFHGTNKCPRGHFKCMEEISVDEVLTACQKLL